MTISPGSVIFVSGNSIVDKLVEFFDRGKYNHCCICIDDMDNICESQYLVNTQIIPNPYPDNEITVINLGLSDDQIKQLPIVATKYLEDKYDIMQIFGILLHDITDGLLHTNVSWNSKRKLICSELVVDILHDIGYFTDKEWQHYRSITPNELYNLLVQRQHLTA